MLTGRVVVLLCALFLGSAVAEFCYDADIVLGRGECLWVERDHITPFDFEENPLACVPASYINPASVDVVFQTSLYDYRNDSFSNLNTDLVVRVECPGLLDDETIQENLQWAFSQNDLHACQLFDNGNCTNARESGEVVNTPCWTDDKYCDYTLYENAGNTTVEFRIHLGNGTFNIGFGLDFPHNSLMENCKTYSICLDTGISNGIFINESPSPSGTPSPDPTPDPPSPTPFPVEEVYPDLSFFHLQTEAELDEDTLFYFPTLKFGENSVEVFGLRNSGEANATYELDVIQRNQDWHIFDLGDGGLQVDEYALFYVENIHGKKVRSTATVRARCSPSCTEHSSHITFPVVSQGRLHEEATDIGINVVV